MKIAVIAANGRSGEEFVNLALNEGYDIRAGVFGSHNFIPNPKLEIVACNALKSKDIEKLVEGANVVVSLIGHTKKSNPNVQTIAIKNVIKSVKDRKVKIISLTGTGVRIAGDKPSLIDRFLNIGIKIIDSVRVNDGIDHVRVLRESSSNWTVIRVLKLTNGPAKPFALIDSGPAKLLTSRQEVAKAILQVINTDQFDKNAPIISNPT